jgi:hypothetical protein
MAIQVSCPQCQKTYTLPDEKRGKQIRCHDCFQVFHAGEPLAGAPSATAPSAAGPKPKPAPPPAPKPKPAAAVKPAPKPAAVKPAPKPAAVKPAPKPAPKPASKKPAPATAPQSFADLEPMAAADNPTTAKYRRRSVRWILALMVLFLLVMCGGGATVGVLAFQGKLPISLAAFGLGDSRQAANKPPNKEGAGESTPKPDNPDTQKADQLDAPKLELADKPKDPSADKLAASVTKENFDKIDKGMTKQDLIALLGPPSENRGSAFVWNGSAGKILVTAPQGKVISKGNSQSWPIVYPGDAAKTP